MNCANLKFKFYPGLSNFFKMEGTFFGVIIFQDFAEPSLQNGLPVLADGMHHK